jgi:hypothetical protein
VVFESAIDGNLIYFCVLTFKASLDFYKLQFQLMYYITEHSESLILSGFEEFWLNGSRVVSDDP